MRHAMGVAVFSGMLGVTFFGLLLTPVFYLTARRLWPLEARAEAHEDLPEPAPGE
jgi:multidrug efflux pump